MLGTRLRRRRAPWPTSVQWKGRNCRRIAPVALAAIIVIFVGYRQRNLIPTRSDDWAVYHDRTFSVSRVIDGDTLDIDCPDATTGKPRTRIRLWGIDAPETGYGSSADMYYGSEASAFAQELLDGQQVHIVLSTKKTRGKYGRLLAYVYFERGGRMFNEMILEEGCAFADRRFAHHYVDRFEAIEKRARKAGAGMWAGIKSADMPAWRQRYEDN
jgi:endonuclease YncB( thermonuclease family)